MTDEELVKRLREPWDGGFSRRMAEEFEAANRIEALTEQLEAARLDAREAEAYSAWLERRLAKAAEALRHAKLNMPHPDQMIDDTLAELKGDKP
jgi:hypothetical protein